MRYSKVPSIQDFPMDRIIQSLKDSADYGECVSFVVTHKALDVFKKNNLRFFVFKNSRNVKKQSASGVIKSLFQPCVAERLTRESRQQ